MRARGTSYIERPCRSSSDRARDNQNEAISQSGAPAIGYHKKTSSSSDVVGYAWRAAAWDILQMLHTERAPGQCPLLSPAAPRASAHVSMVSRLGTCSSTGLLFMMSQSLLASTVEGFSHCTSRIQWKVVFSEADITASAIMAKINRPP